MKVCQKATRRQRPRSVFLFSDKVMITPKSPIPKCEYLEKQNLMAYRNHDPLICVVKKVGVWKTAKVKPDYLFRETETLNISTI